MCTYMHIHSVLPVASQCTYTVHCVHCTYTTSTRVPWYVPMVVHVYVQLTLPKWYLKNNLKYKHSVTYSSMAYTCTVSVPFLVRTMVHVHHGTRVRTRVPGTWYLGACISIYGYRYGPQQVVFEIMFEKKIWPTTEPMFFQSFWRRPALITLSQKQLEIQALRCNGDTSQLARSTYVPWYGHTMHDTMVRTIGTRVRTMVPFFGTLCTKWYTCTYIPIGTTWYTYTNITLSQKRLEIQALRCNGNTSGRCQHRRHHGIRTYHGIAIPWYQWYSSTYTCTYSSTVPVVPLVVHVYSRVPWYFSCGIWYYHGSIP